MKFMARIRNFLLLSTLILITSFSLKADENPVVATVNGQNIYLDELNQNYRENRMFVSDQRVTREKVLNDMINRLLGIERAKKEGLDNNPLVRSRMLDVLYHAQISKDLEDKLQKINVTEQDVRNYYREHPEYRTAHILFRIQVDAEQAEWEAALKAALEVYNRLKNNPGEFAELAQRYSQASNAPNGGDMGFVPANRLPYEYFQAIKGKSNGHITPPVRTQYGYHIIRVMAVKDFNDINMPYYKKSVYDVKRDAILAEYFKSHRDNAEITINSSHL